MPEIILKHRKALDSRNSIHRSRRIDTSGLPMAELTPKEAEFPYLQTILDHHRDSSDLV